ncbi:ThiF family adenylyltransferase [Sphingomonas sp. BAUL-RG-20F-R05-02]|uniref:ThiF family adenylyltransferase n=1 Tax=Sphingomonas sp. BAUL-RG-20F-R05-02 TaxID=2914830 RepID=UPI001F55D7DD|nr:ThiF family adenylyltransferase [Sphingomonas sp. BAUL-RG-20F-R05-02]
MPAEPESGAAEGLAAGPFVYADTGSTRAGIDAVSHRLAGGTIAIIGLGGTGSVVLDLISKTPAERILLIDGDRAEQHNAFRWPGAMPIEDIAAASSKVDYFARVYGRMHTGISPHMTHLAPDTIDLVDDADFVFVCVDSVEARAFIIPALEARGLPFIDCGLGLSLVDDRLMGLVRVTTSTPTMRAHVHAKDRIPMLGDADDELYRSNIQVADLNMLAGTLAVIQYKQLRGFYLDTEAEYHAIYSTDGNTIINDDRP